MLVTTLIALVQNIWGFFQNRQYLLLTVGTALLLVGAGIVVEGLRAFARRDRHEDDDITFTRD